MRTVTAVVLALLLAATCCAEERVLQRVAAIGASATRGFNLTLDIEHHGAVHSRKVALADVLDAAITDPHEPVMGVGDLFFFAGPKRSGTLQQARALGSKPTLVVAVDFLFWFGYGAVNAEGKPMAGDADRLALLEEGLKLLDKFECPVVVGDFPDMSAAVGGMLSELQMPSPEALRQLNERLHAWAKDRPKTVVVPLADVVARMQKGEEIVIGPHRWTGDGAPLLQPDELHPTVDGTICLAQLLLHHLHEAKLVAQPAADAATLRTQLKEMLRKRIPNSPPTTSSVEPPASRPAAVPH